MAAVDSGEARRGRRRGPLAPLSRDIEHSASIRKRFAFSGVRLIGIADGIDTLGNGGDLLYGVKSILSEQYLKDLGDKTSRGLRDRAQGGRVTGALPYGYASAAAADGQGKVPVIVAAQAAVVQRIFRMRAAGRSYRDIAKDAQRRRGRATARATRRIRENGATGGPMSGVRSMLQNSKYAGRWTFGARSWKKSPTTGKRVVRPARVSDGRDRAAGAPHRGRSRPGPSSRARNDASPKAVRGRWAIRLLLSKGGASTARRVYPLSTLVRCGVCGGPMVIEKTQKASLPV